MISLSFPDTSTSVCSPKGGAAHGETTSERRRKYPQAEGWPLGRTLHRRPRPRYRKGHLQKCLGQNSGGSQRKAEESNRGRRYSRLQQSRAYTVGQWLDTWLEDYAKLSIRPSSHKTYQGFIENHIKPAIGNIPLEKLTSIDLQKLYKKLLESGRVDRIEARSKPKGLSVKTVRNINQMISSACNCAVEQRIITVNPTRGCALPKLEKKEMKILPLDCLTTFFEEAKRSGVFELYYIDLSTGLRRGELLGLKWSDIDLKKGVIRIQRQILRQNGAVVEAPLKTKNSYRNIAIGKDAVALLKQMKQGSTSEYVFPSPAGGPISPDSVLHKLQRVLKRAGLEKIPFHSLRHTFSVLALQNGVDVKTLSSMLGHYSAGFTLDTYAHVTTAMQTKAANTVSSFLSGAIQ